LIDAPTVDEIRSTQARLDKYLLRTPTIRCASDKLTSLAGCNLFAKLELFQKTGTFKARGALNSVLSLGRPSPRVTAVSAGNHAVAAAYAAHVLDGDAKVIMLNSANPYRVELARAYGAEIIFADNGKAAFEMAQDIAHTENRAFIHPFDGKAVAEATGGVGLELMEDMPGLDAVIVAIGGGGLAGGVAAAVKQLDPRCVVYGVEPEGAAVMSLSLKMQKPAELETLDSIADSLSAPLTTPFPFEMSMRFIDEIITVSDDQIAHAVAISFSEMKLALEPAGATALAAALGPLKDKLAGKNVAIIVCGSNIDSASFSKVLERGEAIFRQSIAKII